MSGSESAASLLDVSFRYSTETGLALQEVSLDVAADSFTLVTGPSGAGKSTLAKMIAGFLPRHIKGDLQGEVELLGTTLDKEGDDSPADEIGFVFDNPFDQLTGSTRSLFDEVAFALENRGVAPELIVERVMGALSAVGLADRMAQHPREISGGQSQRLAMATVIAQHQNMVVLDDPTSQLDPLGRDEVIELTREMRGRGVTVVVVAHDLAGWLPLADALVVMDAGRIVAAGTPREVLADLDAIRHLLWVPRFVDYGRILAAEGAVDEDVLPLSARELADCLTAHTSGGTLR
ncbi:energy-coupling factor ABC transporter ATP-binding protein [Nonomuraea sp. NPDC050790]|uniref:energy-coupling factor ABC transporter ATP-binding protein n=1 Tax=Nonomuraea sp. NPDC050790 TaxID=3364371 RepID=UPI00379CB4AF